MDKKLTFTIEAGGKASNVVVAPPPGGGTSYHIYVDNFYNGSMVKYSGTWDREKNEHIPFTDPRDIWQVSLSANSLLTVKDIDYIRNWIVEVEV